jgi:hypothetical protein
MTLSGADLGQWREPEPTGKVAVHFVNAEAELQKRVRACALYITFNIIVFVFTAVLGLGMVTILPF